MIKRYDLYSNCDCTCGDYGLSEVSEGDYVKFEDHERKVKELERRVGYLEKLFASDDAFSYSESKPLHVWDSVWDCDCESDHLCENVETRPCCYFCDAVFPEEHSDSCSLFLPDGTPKPTPEGFK